MAITTSANWQKSLWPGLDGWFNDSYDAWDKEYPDIYTTRESDKQFEQVVGMSLTGRAVIKPEGKNLSYDDVQQTFTNQFNHQVRALGLIITEELYSDNQYNLDILSRQPKALANSMNHTKEEAGANTVNNGFDSTVTMGSFSDGKELFANDHPSGVYGSDRSNLLTASDLSETTLEDGIIQIAAAVDVRGLKVKIMPYCLLIPPELDFIAGKILESTLQNDTANNALNIIKAHQSLPGGYKINHYLSDSDAWFIVTSINQEGGGLIHYQRWPLKFGQDNDFDNFNMKVKAWERYSFGWYDFLGMFGNQGN